MISVANLCDLTSEVRRWLTVTVMKMLDSEVLLALGSGHSFQTTKIRLEGNKRVALDIGMNDRQFNTSCHSTGTHGRR